MATYRLVRPLPSSSLLLESSLALSESNKPVVVLRFKAPWSQVPGFLDRFAPWQRGWQSLHDVDGLINFMEAGQAGQAPAVVQEAMEGECLRTVLRTPGKSPFSVLESVAVVLQAARGLVALEQLSPASSHGDVCASSLSLGVDGSVRLDALGLAAATPADATLGPARAELTCLAPEEVDGQRGLRTDVFRLGVVWMELLTGRTTFAATSYAEVKARFEKFPGVTAAHFPSLPPAVAGVLAAMLAKAPTARPVVSDLELLLRQAFESLGGSLPETTLAPAFARLFPGRAPGLAGLQGGAVLTISTPSVKLARISTKKVTAEEMAAANAQLASEAARTTAKEWGQAHARDADNPKDFALGVTLLEQQKVTVDALDRALLHSQSMGGSLFEALCMHGTLDEDEVLPLAAGLLKQASLTGPQLLELKLGPTERGLLPSDFAEEWMVLPLKLESGALTVAMRDPSRMDVLDEVKQRSRARVVNGVRATERTLKEGLARLYAGKTSPPDWTVHAKDSPLPPGPMELEFELDAGAAFSPLLTTPPPQKSPLVSAGPPELSMGAALRVGMDSPQPDPLPRRGEGDVGNTLALRSGERAGVKGPAPASALDVPMRLLDAALALAGDRGLEASELRALVRDVARQAGASGPALDQVRLAVTAVVLGALMESRRAFELPSRPSVAAALGPHWSQFESVLRPLLEGDGRANDPRGVVIALCFELAQSLGAVPKRLADAQRALEPLRAKYPRPAVSALEAVLSADR